MSTPPTEMPPGFTRFLPDDAKLMYPGHLGPFYKKRIGNSICVAIRLDDRHCNPFGEAHGGFIAGLADMALGNSVLQHPESAPASIATLSINVQYLANAKLGDWVEAVAHADRIGRSIAFATVEFLVGSKRIAQGSATFKVLSKEALQRRKSPE